MTGKNSNRPLMIYSRKQVRAGTNIIPDHVVVSLYPERNLGDGYTIFFQQEELNVSSAGFTFPTLAHKHPEIT